VGLDGVKPYFWELLLTAFVFEARPVVPVMDAVRVELEAIAFCDGLKPR
jgi:hypothetical protein